MTFEARLKDSEISELNHIALRNNILGDFCGIVKYCSNFMVGECSCLGYAFAEMTKVNSISARREGNLYHLPLELSGNSFSLM